MMERETSRSKEMKSWLGLRDAGSRIAPTQHNEIMTWPPWSRAAFPPPKGLHAFARPQQAALERMARAPLPGCSPTASTGLSRPLKQAISHTVLSSTRKSPVIPKIYRNNRALCANGGGGGNRTPVRECSLAASTGLGQVWSLIQDLAPGRACLEPVRLRFSLSARRTSLKTSLMKCRPLWLTRRGPSGRDRD